jgi:hypothetical protein
MPEPIEVQIVRRDLQVDVYPQGIPGPRGASGGTSVLTETFETANWEDDPDFTDTSRLVFGVDSAFASVWETEAGRDVLRTDTVVLSREQVDGTDSIVVRVGSGNEFEGFLAYLPTE